MTQQSNPCKTIVGRKFVRALSCAERGTALTEFVIYFPVLYLMVMGIMTLGEYAVAQQQAVAASRLFAWQRTAWLPSSVTNGGGVSGANKKEDTELVRDLARHSLRDRSRNALSIHQGDALEFSPGPANALLAPQWQLNLTTSQTGTLPAGLNAVDTALSGLKAGQNVLKDSYLTQGLGNFQFVTNGLLKNRVRLTYTPTLPNPFLEQAVLNEQVTLLTEAWNAGGSPRENSKVAGLVPLSLLNAPPYASIRSALGDTAYAIQFVLPGFDRANLDVGWKPGLTDEVAPSDRFEQAVDKDGKPVSKKFVYYYSLPPAPPRGSLP